LEFKSTGRKLKQRVKKQWTLANKNKTYELRKRWENRKKILESSIRKMRFVKVEFISLMRRMADKIKNNKDADSITTYQAAPQKGQ
jgi:ATP adenylyltransferase/5',5'''-P-1,P-4-tetraphosphate phosphorylase II